MPLVDERLVDNPRLLAAAIARALDGIAVDSPGLSGFASSDFDPFLNHVFAVQGTEPSRAVESLAGKPGFVWLAETPTPGEVSSLGTLAVMHGMTARTSASTSRARNAAEILEVRSYADLDDWHAVYTEVFGADRRSREDWRRVHDALGPEGDGSLLLLLARLDGRAAATGGVFFEHDLAGLYCFTTLEGARGRGLASALIEACHAAARGRGIADALLQATKSGLSVYAQAGYSEERPLPVLRVPPAD